MSNPQNSKQDYWTIPSSHIQHTGRPQSTQLDYGISIANRRPDLGEPVLLHTTHRRKFAPYEAVGLNHLLLAGQSLDAHQGKTVRHQTACCCFPLSSAPPARLE